MKVLAEYANHHYMQEWTNSGTDYCPGCGSIGTVWVETGEGDYYCGPSNVCTHCRCEFTIQGPAKSDGVYGKIIDQIKSGITLEPKTPRGN